MIVDYRATTGLHCWTAVRTCSDIFRIEWQMRFMVISNIIIG